MRVFVLITVTALTVGNAGSAEGTISFNREVRPILSDHCFPCHGPDEQTREANLRLDESASAADVLQNRLDGEFWRRVTLDAGDDDLMPPPSVNNPLTKAELATLRQWLEADAPYEKHWSFEPIQRPRVPSTESHRFENPIDAFIQRRLDAEGLETAPRASKETRIRRLSLDLTGLPPTSEEIDAYLADDRIEATERLIDRLLDSPRFGERMAWMWLEAARYADTDGYQNDGPRNMWRWRDWVIGAFNDNMPFDQFTIEQLAGDLLPKSTRDQRIATGFHRNHRYNSEAGIPLDEFLLENAVDRVDTTATVWMGLTLGCARCHDHKYDPFSQKEYYQLIDYFNDVAESGRAIKYGNSEPWIHAPTPEQETRLAALEQEANEALRSYRDLHPTIDREIENWNTEEADEMVVVSQGLSQHFPGPYTFERDAPAQQLAKQVEGLICNGRFSIAFEMTPDTVASGAVLTTEINGTTRSGILVEFHEGRLLFHIITRWIAGVATLETLSPLEVGEPVHVLLTNDGTQRAKGMRIYLNGALEPTRITRNTNSNMSGRAFGGPLRLGASPHVGPWLGTIRELRFYNQRTLRPEEATVLAASEKPSVLAAMASADRSAPQKEVLRRAFLSTLPEDHSWRAALDNAYQTEAQRIAFIDQLPTTMVMEDAEEPTPSFVRTRGVYDAFGAAAPADVPGALPPLPPDAPNNRWGLGQWLVSSDHPLTGRVIANRIWALLFGTGLVDTPEDFGAQGHLPSHPELLDWLASELRDSGWDLKAFLKTITTSETYHRASIASAEARTLDPQNRWLSHGPRHRLPASALRDQALFLAGLLVERQGGPSVKPYQPANLWREASNFSYSVGSGDDLYRRSLYTYWKRTLAPPAMATLDANARESCAVRERRTNTPLQALTLLNEPGLFEAARGMATEALRQGDNQANQLTWLFRSATARIPSKVEFDRLLEAHQSFTASYALDPDAATDALKVGSSVPPPDLDPVALASLTALANAILNLDETTSRE